MENSKIEWTTHTFNPWIGCTKVSPGCLNCYAERLMDKSIGRFSRVQWGKGNPRARTAPSNWRKPLQWNKAAEGLAERPRVFCASLADWLDHEVPDEWRADLLRLIEQTPNLDWLLLTKRPEEWEARMEAISSTFEIARAWYYGTPPANVWVGTSAEDQKRWNERLPELVKIPAVSRFVSAEPLLGPIRIPMDGPRPDWLIVGGESGAGARPMSADWVRDLRGQCIDRGDIAFYFKQWGGVNKHETGRILDGRTWDEYPNPAHAGTWRAVVSKYDTTTPHGGDYAAEAGNP